MMKKLMLIVVGIGVMALFIESARTTIKSKSEFLTVVHEISVLTDKSVEIMGNAPTLASVNQAKQFIDERKSSIKGKLQAFRNEGRLREKSGEYLQLEFAADSNKNKIAKFYDEFVEKANSDYETSIEEKEKLEAKRTISRKDFEMLEKKSKLIKQNYEVIKAMDSLMASYKTIFEKN